MISIVHNNPFRILGILSNARQSEIVRNNNKLKAFLSIGKSVDFPMDIPSLFGDINRTADSVADANQRINLPADKFLYGIFWFNGNCQADKDGISSLQSGDTQAAMELFSNSFEASSKINAATLSIAIGDIRKAVSLYEEIARSENNINNIARVICDETFQVSRTEFIKSIFGTLLSEYPAKDISAVVTDDEIKAFVNAKALELPLKKLSDAIQIAKGVKSDDPEASFEAGIRLKKEAEALLPDICQICGSSAQEYASVADKVAKQVLQCGINYYNSSSDLHKALKAIELLKYAQTIAVGNFTQQRCKDQINILTEKIKSLPPKELMGEATIINNKLNAFRQSSKSTDKVVQLIVDCAPYLAEIKEKQGNAGCYYLKISTDILKVSLEAIDSNVKKALKALECADEVGKQNAILKVHSALKEAWTAIQYMDVLDIQTEVKNIFFIWETSLENIMQKAGMITYSNVSFKLETETEIFNKCKTKSDYKSYLTKFPEGRYNSVARKKIEDIERAEQRKKQKLCSSISASTLFADAIALYSQCNEVEIKNLLDDKCFSLCKSKPDFKRYIEVFGWRARHLSEANSHLKFENFISKVKEWINEHIGWTIFICIILVVLVGIGLIWGLRGYGGLCCILAMISLFFAMGVPEFFGRNNDKGCLVIIIAGVMCAVFAAVGSAIINYCETQTKNEEAEKIFRQLGSEPSEEACASFVRKYSSSPHYDDVMTMYLRAAEKNGAISLNEFANKYGNNNEFGKKASDRVAQICDSLYNLANARGTIESWQEYMSKVPTDYFKDARLKLIEIKDLAWNTDSKAWQQATKENTISAYQKYLSMYPKGTHHADADKKVIDMQVADIYADNHGTLPAMNKTGYGGGYTSNIEIKNSTSHTLTLLYSGPDSKRVILSPYQIGHISLKNGTYRVAASVSASSVRNFAGTENLNGGDYSVEYYIVTSKY